MRAVGLTAFAGALLALSAAAPAAANERTLSVTDFDRLRVEGNFVVEVTTGRGTSARLSGSQMAIEGATVEVQGRTLTVRRNASAWGGYPGKPVGLATVTLTVPALQSASVSGAAVVRIDRMRGPRIALSLGGAGALTVAQVTSDRLDVALLGAGRVTVGGTVADLIATVRGSGDLDAAKMAVADAKLFSGTAGTVTLAARRSAAIEASGSGSVTVTGKPACTVTNSGAGTVVCGS